MSPLEVNAVSACDTAILMKLTSIGTETDAASYLRRVNLAHILLFLFQVDGSADADLIIELGLF
jgi:hypothetical protein